MITIKITSNPYKRVCEFKKLDVTSGDWMLIDCEKNPSSKLISEEIRNGFFPYKVKEIVEQIKADYHVEGEDIQLVFEGSADEYLELERICRKYDFIELIKYEAYLENARDILPKIMEIFAKIKPIVDSNINDEASRETIEKNIEKLLDASNDTIPICVLGNYSSGKSTFINALIGMEILPSGDMPVTAKIYKIKQSRSANSAVINFECNREPISVFISDNEYEISCSTENELITSLQECLEDNNEASLVIKVNNCLGTINKAQDEVSDLINIQIPFADSPISRSKNSFVIFDTPGSNSATHKDHFSILEGAMKNLSNGIPIYVAEFNSLDSCDNEALYEKIRSISQIDSRFTMIVVNKADKANIEPDDFDEDMVNNILSQAVPRNLYSGGIYFVSSFMGMGAKNDGKFINKYTAREYSKSHHEYEDDSCEWYQQLYKYNIMPEQIKENITSISEEYDNKILANSGLLAVENEIVNFAEKYSAYDKCKQSDKYISHIIDETSKEIEIAKAHSEELKHKLEEAMEKEELNLARSISDNGDSMKNSFMDNYDEHMSDCYEAERFFWDQKEIKSAEKEILARQKEQVNYSKKKQNFFDSLGLTAKDFFSGITEKEIDDAIKTVGGDIKNAYDDGMTLFKLKCKSDKATEDELLQMITEDFNCRGDYATKNIDNYSKSYWEKNCKLFKDSLLKIITNAASIEDDEKDELSKIIMNYTDIDFGKEYVFEKDNFERKLKLLGSFYISLNKLKIKKLTDTYNADFNNSMKKVALEIRNSHMQNFDDWQDELLDELEKNLVSYSPVLSDHAINIELEKKKMRMLVNTKQKLENYSREIQSLMNWIVIS